MRSVLFLAALVAVLTTGMADACPQPARSRLVVRSVERVRLFSRCSPAPAVAIPCVPVVPVVPVVPTPPKKGKTPSEELTEALNTERAKVGLPPLALDPTLNATAQRWAEFMATSGQFRHGGGESVIAMGHSSVREVIAGWMASPGHRAWLLSQSPAAGWGFAIGAGGTPYWAGAFNGSVVNNVSVSVNRTRIRGRW